MRAAKHLPLLITVTALIAACGSNNFAGEAGTVQAPAKQESAKDKDSADASKADQDETDSDDLGSSLGEETDACNAQGGILLNEQCQICPVGQSVDVTTQSCVALTADAGVGSGGIGDSGSSVDVGGIMNVFGELIKNLPKDDGSGGDFPGGGGCE